MGKKITVQATVGKTRSLVWELYNRPGHIVNWNFASDDWHCPEAHNDLRVGGKLKSRMESRDESMGFDFEATYEEIVEGEKLSYVMDDGRRVHTIFEDLGGKTRIYTTFEAEDENPEEMQRSGWQAILDNFVKYADSV